MRRGGALVSSASTLSKTRQAAIKAAVSWLAAFDDFVEADVAEMEGRIAWRSPLLDEAERRREAEELALAKAVRAYLAAKEAAK